MMIKRRGVGFRGLGGQESGAVALLCLAGALILVMMGLMLFDTIEATSDKVHIQASTDAAAHSQASVVARSMNMTAFANVGKRINVGYVAAHETAFAWLEWLRNAGILFTIGICAAALIPGLQFLGPICPQVALITAGATCAWDREHTDHLNMRKVVNGTFGPEVRGFHNYQYYMSDITPYWAWSKGLISGYENRAPMTMSYPLPGPADSLGNQARLPIEVEGSHSWDAMCEKANETSFDIERSADRWMMAGDFLIKSITAAVGNLLNSMKGKALKRAFDDAGLGDAYELIKDTETVLDTADATDAAIDDIFGEEPDCEEVEEMADNDNDVELNQCPDDAPETCTPTLTVHGEVMDIDSNCVPTDEHGGANVIIGLRSIADAAGLSCTQFMKSPQTAGGYYGAIFLSGILALTVNFEGINPGGLAGKFVDLLQSAVPDFSSKCVGLTEAGSDGLLGLGWIGTSEPAVFNRFAEDGQAWLLDTSDWMMDSSSLMVGYRPNSLRNKQMRENYFMDEVNPAAQGLQSSGYWAMSRGELTWQGAREPSLWESQWGSRVRPVSIGDEWGSQAPIEDMMREMQNEMAAVVLNAHADEELVGRGAYATPFELGADLAIDVQSGFGSMEGSNMSGVGK